jgi:hypothetical protein
MFHHVNHRCQILVAYEKGQFTNSVSTISQTIGQNWWTDSETLKHVPTSSKISAETSHQKPHCTCTITQKSYVCNVMQFLFTWLCAMQSIIGLCSECFRVSCFYLVLCNALCFLSIWICTPSSIAVSLGSSVLWSQYYFCLVLHSALGEQKTIRVTSLAPT